MAKCNCCKSLRHRRLCNLVINILLFYFYTLIYFYVYNQELRQRLGEEVDVEELPDLLKFGHVDDEYVTFEWSAGGMVHVHMAFWIVGAPRIDKIEVPRGTRRGIMLGWKLNTYRKA